MWPFKKSKIKIKEAAASGIDPDEHLWRRLSDRVSRNELSPYEQDNMIKAVSYLYARNPIAKRIVELTRDFVLGEGITIKADNPEVQEVLDEFWDDPENQWDLKQHDRVLELGLYGEQCFVVFVNEFNGRVRIGNLDPARIGSVSPDPDNSERADTVNIRTGTSELRPLKVIRLGETGFLEGKCFYFSINRLGHETRGRSDIFALADWLDGYESYLFNRLEKASLVSSFVWDVTLEGMTEEEITAWLRKNGKPPKPGSIRAHNEKVKWDTAAPSLNADDAAVEALLMKQMIAGGSGKPLHWLGSPEDANRATAQAMGEPTLKSLTTRQKYVRYTIEHMLRFVLDQAIIHNRLSPTIDTTHKVILPEISKKDTKDITESVNKLSSALALAEERGWISKETSASLFAVFAGQLGVEINVGDELKAAEKDKENDKTQDYADKTSN